MSNKKKRTVRNTTSHDPNYNYDRRRERNAFIRNHPFIYAIVYLGTFLGGMYLFDLIVNLF